MSLQIEKTVFDTIRAEGLPVNIANLVTAQSKHESANYTSNVFKTCNNLFGYKFVGQALASKGIAAPAKEGDYYAKYKTVADSARELARWIKRRVAEGKFPKDLTSIKTPSQYAQLLKQANYYGDNLANYTAGLQRFFKDYSTGISTSLILFAGIGLYLLVK